MRHQAPGIGTARELLLGKGGTSGLIVLGLAVVDGIVEPDRRFDGFGIAEQRSIVGSQRQHRLDMSKVVIVGGPFGLVERRKLGFQSSVDQGFVFHGCLNSCEPNPFDEALRKIEFNRGQVIWLICAVKPAGPRTRRR